MIVYPEELMAKRIAALEEGHIKLLALRRYVQHMTTEIGLQTYGRRGAEMVQTTTDQKLQYAERMVREMRDEIFSRIDALTKGKTDA